MGLASATTELFLILPCLFLNFFWVHIWAHCLRARYHLRHHVLHHDGNKTTFKRIKSSQKATMELPLTVISELLCWKKHLRYSTRRKSCIMLLWMWQGERKSKLLLTTDFFFAPTNRTPYFYISTGHTFPFPLCHEGKWILWTSRFLNTHLKTQYRMLPLNSQNSLEFLKAMFPKHSYSRNLQMKTRKTRVSMQMGNICHLNKC